MSLPDRRTGNKPELYYTMTFVLAIALLCLLVFTLVVFVVPQESRGDALVLAKDFDSTMGILVGFVVGGHIMNLAGGGGGLLGMVKTFGTSAQPYGMPGYGAYSPTPYIPQPPAPGGLTTGLQGAQGPKSTI
jgi:hypothetical protein